MKASYQLCIVLHFSEELNPAKGGREWQVPGICCDRLQGNSVTFGCTKFEWRALLPFWPMPLSDSARNDEYDSR